MVGSLRSILTCLSAMLMAPATSAIATPPNIPQSPPPSARTITTADLNRVRDIDSLSLSSDGRLYAVLVREADPDANAYRTGWFIGSSAGGPLTLVGDGGQARLREDADGRRTGIIVGSPGRWSPDGRTFAYSALNDGEVQLWVTGPGQTARQLTNHPADVREFAWTDDGRALLFTAGTARHTLAAQLEAQRRAGFLLQDYQFSAEIISQPGPDRPLESKLTSWIVTLDGAPAHEASADQQAMFERARARNFSWGRSQPERAKAADLFGAAAPPIVAPDGSLAWLERTNPEDKGGLPFLRLTASRRPDGSMPVRCLQDACLGQYFAETWWDRDSREVLFWRKEDTNLVENGFYAWSPETGRVRKIFRHDGDEFQECELHELRLVCARETINRPDHVVAIDVTTGKLEILSDPNPEFRSLHLGEVERFTYDAAPDVHQLGYPTKMVGYILYPPNFDPRRKWPVFIAPYGAPGFRRGDVGNEHPLFVYAANGFLVLSTQFPVPLGTQERSMSSDNKLFYDPEKDFPHLTMLADSTFNALDTVAKRGFVDHRRVGIGGLSHGSFVPMFMLQRHDRIAAASVSGPSWSQFEYYGRTGGTEGGATKSSWPESNSFWSKIDLADHVEEVEAPLLINYADREYFHDWRLAKRMQEGGRAFEARIFPDEYHVKWQPAHLLSIYNQNLDWFRFWLKDEVDPDPAKAAQYARWKELRTIQCRNRRSIRDFCQH